MKNVNRLPAAPDSGAPFINTDARGYSRIGWGIVTLGVAGFLLWASLAPLDKGVPLSGHVAVASNRKAVQHQMGGTVDEILVKDGDPVRAGQVLLKMNGVAAGASADTARTLWYMALASEARLAAERDGAREIRFPQALGKAAADPRVGAATLGQQQLFAARQAALRSELAAIDENMAGMQIQSRGLQEAMVSKKEQQRFLKEQLENMRDLARDGYVPRNRLLDIERAYAQGNAGMAEDIGSIGRIARQIAEAKLNKLQRQQNFQKEVQMQLAEAHKETETLHNRVLASDLDLQNATVRAPVDGTVVGLSVFTRGAVVAGGFRLMEIVPKNDALIVEGMLPVHLVDKVQVGLKAELIFSAFNANTTPHIPGVLAHVSADRMVDERTGVAYYPVRAVVAPEGVTMLAQLQIRPGMPVEILVKTGERTMMSYLLKPVFDRINTAMTED